MLTKERIAEVLSKILSDQYEADIRIVLKSEKKEADKNVQNMPTDTMPESVSQCNAQDCA